MDQGVSRAWRLVTGVIAATLLSGCSSGAIAPSTTPTTTSAAVRTPSAAPAASTLPSPTNTPAATSTAKATPRPTPTPAVAATRDIAYGASDSSTPAEQLDVYAPATSGRWPVVVLLHGAGPVSKNGYTAQAEHVAAAGFVVFVPNWSQPVGSSSGDVPTPARFDAYASEVACAVAFARTHATEYGGDPATVILFGHSGGANVAGRVVFGRPAPTRGCPSGTTLGPIHALVTWDGDWTLTDPSWDERLAADPSAWKAITQLSSLSSDRKLRVVMLASGKVGDYVRDLSDPKAMATFFKVRDPSGALQRTLQAIGALDDKAYDIQEMQRLLYAMLKEQGNPVSLTLLPDTSHDSFGAAMDGPGMAVFVRAFKEAAQP